MRFKLLTAGVVTALPLQKQTGTLLRDESIEDAARRIFKPLHKKSGARVDSQETCSLRVYAHSALLVTVAVEAMSC